MGFLSRTTNNKPEEVSMLRKQVGQRMLILLGIVALAVVVPNPFDGPTKSGNAAAATSISIYGAWHAGNDACTWGSVRNMVDFDAKNRWLIDRGDGIPSVNMVVLSFVNPLKLLNKTTDAQTSQG